MKFILARELLMYKMCALIAQWIEPTSAEGVDLGSNPSGGAIDNLRRDLCGGASFYLY